VIYQISTQALKTIWYCARYEIMKQI